jgi:hypothetical protein
MSPRSLMHRVFPPSKPPDGGYPPSFRLIVGGTQLRGSWYLSVIVRLQGFSSHSPVAPLRWWSPKTVTSSSWMGRGKSGCDPALSIGGVRHPRWGGERGEPGLYLLRGSAGHLFFQLLVRLGAARSLALIAGSRPLSGTTNESPPVAASTRDHGCCCRGRWQVPRRSSPRKLEVAHARGGRNQSSVCDGTSNASVFVHRGCRGLNMYVILARSRVFSSFSSIKTRLLII